MASWPVCLSRNIFTCHLCTFWGCVFGRDTRVMQHSTGRWSLLAMCPAWGGRTAMLTRLLSSSSLVTTT